MNAGGDFDDEVDQVVEYKEVKGGFPCPGCPGLRPVRCSTLVSFKRHWRSKHKKMVHYYTCAECKGAGKESSYYKTRDDLSRHVLAKHSHNRRSRVYYGLMAACPPELSVNKEYANPGTFRFPPVDEFDSEGEEGTLGANSKVSVNSFTGSALAPVVQGAAPPGPVCSVSSETLYVKDVVVVDTVDTELPKVPVGRPRSRSSSSSSQSSSSSCSTCKSSPAKKPRIENEAGEHQLPRSGTSSVPVSQLAIPVDKTPLAGTGRKGEEESTCQRINKATQTAELEEPLIPPSWKEVNLIERLPFSRRELARALWDIRFLAHKLQEAEGEVRRQLAHMDAMGRKTRWED